jgi:DNA-binding HxlR family transcriptional regulator
VVELDRAGGSRFVSLAHTINISRASLRRTLDALIETGFVMRNAGYGHPLRPEYVLTDRGRRVAPAASALLDALRRRNAERVGLKKWSLPILLVLTTGHRYSEVRELLPGITSRGLSLALSELCGAGLVERHASTTVRPSYRTTARGRPLCSYAANLAAVVQ